MKARNVDIIVTRKCGGHVRHAAAHAKDGRNGMKAANAFNEGLADAVTNQTKVSRGRKFDTGDGSRLVCVERVCFYKLTQTRAMAAGHSAWSAIFDVATTFVNVSHIIGYPGSVKTDRHNVRYVATASIQFRALQCVTGRDGR